MRLSSLLPVLPLRAWLGFSYLAVLTFPVAAVLATGALGRDLVNQTRWDLEHQAALVAMLFIPPQADLDPTVKLFADLAHLIAFPLGWGSYFRTRLYPNRAHL